MSLCSQKQVQQQQLTDASTLPSHAATAEHLKSTDKLADVLILFFFLRNSVFWHNLCTGNIFLYVFMSEKMFAIKALQKSLPSGSFLGDRL